MANTSLIRTVWSQRLLYNLEKNLVYGNAVNTDYEGDAANAKTVKINSIGDVTIGDYDGTKIADPEDINSASQDLNIDQQKYFNFKVEDILKAQTNILLVDKATSKAAFGLADVMDQFIAGLHTGVSTANQYGNDTTPKIIDTAEKAYEHLVDLSVILDEANVPREGRYAVLPPWYLGLLAKDARFTKEPKVLANGIVEGQNIASMQIRMSNNVPNVAGAKFKVMAGTRDAIAFAQAIKSMESYRPEGFFADAVKGLHVYGAKLVQDKGIAVLTASKS